VCDGWTAQNAAHLQRCPWVGDGIGRLMEQMWEDEEGGGVCGVEGRAGTGSSGRERPPGETRELQSITIV